MKKSFMLTGLLFFYSVGVFAPDWDRLLVGKLNVGFQNGGLPRNQKFFFRAGRPTRPETGMWEGGTLRYLEVRLNGVVANPGGVLLNHETVIILAAMKVEEARVRTVVEDCLKARMIRKQLEELEELEEKVITCYSRR